MVITGIVLVAVGLVAVVSTLYFGADLFVPRCSICSAELEADANAEWLCIDGEGYVGWLMHYARCARCEQISTHPVLGNDDPANAAMS